MTRRHGEHWKCSKCPRVYVPGAQRPLDPADAEEVDRRDCKPIVCDTCWEHIVAQIPEERWKNMSFIFKTWR